MFDARVDGVLRKKRGNEVKAIVEVKPYLPTPNIEAIRMQEAAQMAAWICNYPPDNVNEMRNNQTTTTYVGYHPLRS